MSSKNEVRTVHKHDNLYDVSTVEAQYFKISEEIKTISI